MEYEDYLISTKYHIIAITRMSQLIEEVICEYYWDIVKGKSVEQNAVDEVLALNKTIRATLYCARSLRKEAYKEIEPQYKDEFSYDDIIYS